jgi:hypothetical protein
MALAALVIGIIFANIGGYIDEADNVAVAQLIVLDGSVLYRDLFSHHFPFAYYWTAFFFKLFGISIFNARLAVIILNALAFGSVGLILRNWHVGALAWLIWACVSPFFLGHLMLYQSLAAVALAPVFAGGFAYVSRRPLPNLWGMSLVGLFAAIAILANPLTLFAVGLTFIGIALPFGTGFLPRRLHHLTRQRQFESALCMAFILAPLIGVVLGSFCFLGLNGALGDFYRDVVIFNRDIYARYSDTVRTGLLANCGKIVLNIISGLTLFDPNQRMYPIDTLKTFSVLAEWLISDITFKLIIIFYCLWLALKRHGLAALYVYAFAACALMRGRTNFDQLPLLMCAVVVLAVWQADMLTEVQDKKVTGVQDDRVTRWQDDKETMLPKSIALPPSSFLLHPSSFVLYPSLWLSPLIALLVVIGIDFGVQQRNSPAAAQVLAQDATTALTLQQWVCGQPDVKLGYYPANPYVHFYSQLRPVSRYLFVWPWVAEVGATDIATTLTQAPYSIVSIVTQGDIWGIPNAVSLAPIATVVRRDFVKIDNEGNANSGLYLSRPLYDACVQKMKIEKFKMKN